MEIWYKNKMAELISEWDHHMEVGDKVAADKAMASHEHYQELLKSFDDAINK